MLKNLPCAAKVRNFLEELDKETLIGVAYTATNGTISASSTQEAIEVILNYTSDLSRFFGYKRLRKDMLFGYLSRLKREGVINVPLEASALSTHLIEYTRNYWESVSDVALKTSSPSSVSQTQSDFQPRSLSRGSGKSELPSSPQLPFFPSSPHSSVYPNSSWNLQFPFASLQEPVRHSVSHNPASQVFSQSPVEQNVSQRSMGQYVSQSLVPLDHFKVPAETPNNQTVQTAPQIHFGITVTSHFNFSLEITTNSNGARPADFAKAFCEWFYNIVNNLQPNTVNRSGDTMGEDMFLSDSRAFIYIFSHQLEERKGEGKRGTYQILKDTLTEMRLFFSPDISSGTKISRAGNDTYKIFCSGKLQNGNVNVGIFEQEFDLSERDHLWKIVYTKLNLKQAGPT